MLPAGQGRSIDKIRYSIPFNNRTIELDVFKGNLNGLIIAEIEFSSINEAKKFQKLPWMLVEVTDNSNFKNRNLQGLKNIKEIIKILNQ